MRRAAPLWLIVAACGPGEAPREEAASASDLFVDVAAERGLAGYEHYRGFTPYRYLVETMGGGVGWIDYDLDGWPDVYLVQSAALPESEPRRDVGNHLLRNLEGREFRDRTDAAGVGDRGFGMGCAVGDADGDGSPDLFVTNVGPNVFYRNRADGTFAEDTSASGLGDDGWGVSAGFFDADHDGDLDLYLVNYVVFSRELQRELAATEGGRFTAYPHPDLFDAQADRFYLNDGAGVFRDASEERGFAAALPGKGLGLAFADVENDGDVDVYVANDSTPNFLFVNDGEGHFEELGALLGCAYNADGQTEASMGVGFGHVDGDGYPDLFMTHLDLETNTLYRSRSRGGALEFVDRTRSAGLAVPSIRQTGFGVSFLDYDADGALDLFVANGHIIDNVAQIYSDREYAQRDMLFRNRGDGSFDDVSTTAGAYFERKQVGRGVAAADYDRDGDTDLLVGNCGEAPVLLENRAPRDHHWIRIQLVAGPGEPTAGLGARVAISAGGREQVREVWSTESYASASAPDAHFGLGPALEVDRVEVRWPSGHVQTWEGLSADRRWRLGRDGTTAGE